MCIMLKNVMQNFQQQCRDQHNYLVLHTLLQCGPRLHYSVDLWIQTYTEPVPLKYGKLATKYPSIYGYLIVYGSVYVCLCNSDYR